jgi:hypothetical protein
MKTIFYPDIKKSKNIMSPNKVYALFKLCNLFPILFSLYSLFYLTKIGIKTIFGGPPNDLFTQEYEYLDKLAISYGTDKSSEFHNYTRVYAKYFPYFKTKPIRFLEIGIFKGGSVQLWEDYFPNAELHFVDMTKYFIQYFSKRSQYHFLDQANINVLKNFGQKFGQFDIIIDDGGHVMEQQINSFKVLFDFVKPGGMYVIEDLHTSYNKNYHGSYHQVNHGNISVMEAGKSTAVDFLKQFIDDINFTGALSFWAHNNVTNPLMSNVEYFRSQIDAVHFYTSLCIIFKK